MTPPRQGPLREDPQINPNALHDFHVAKRGPRNIPRQVKPMATVESMLKDPGHPYANCSNISFQCFYQRKSNAPFGYEHYVSVPPAYDQDLEKQWPLILFLHGAGESRRGKHESYASVRHGIPKVVLCYDKLISGAEPSVDIPPASRLRKSKQTLQGDKSHEPVPAEVCTMLAETFVTVSPSLSMENGYGWNVSILSALLDEIVDRYRIDLHRIHVTGFSMGGYGTWDLAMHSPYRFATLMPICGGGDTIRASQVAHVPHWVHHGDKDDIIPVVASLKMVRALEDAKASEVRFTRYPDLMHDSWTETYNDLEVYKWMLQRCRNNGGDGKVVPDENKVAVS